MLMRVWLSLICALVFVTFMALRPAQAHEVFLFLQKDDGQRYVGLLSGIQEKCEDILEVYENRQRAGKETWYTPRGGKPELVLNVMCVKPEER
jgi:hypothetical protein